MKRLVKEADTESKYKNIETNLNIANINNIPKELFYEIIKKLPTCFIFKSYSVCNYWNLNLSHCVLSINDRLENYITQCSIQKLTNLISIDLEENRIITDESVKQLTNLTSINLTWNDTITDESVKQLTNLTSINLDHNKTITDESVKQLINLTHNITR